jgi:ATP synthase protein I
LGVVAVGGNVDTNAPDGETFQPLTRAEADALRGRFRLVSPGRLLLLQGLVGLLTAACAALLGGGWSTALSALYGAAVVVLPGILLAWALRARPGTVSAAQRAVSFLFWELVKIALAVAMLVLAPRVVEGLSWLALLAGMVLSMKVYGLALLWRGR